MSTQMSYNNISLGFIRTIQIEQAAVREPSDSDYIYTRIAIRVSSLLNRDIIPPALAGGTESPTATMKRIRAALLTDCQQLIFSVAGETFFSSPDTDETEDVKHGPKPLYCNIMRIDGGSTFHIEFGIETYVYDQNCVDHLNPYVSNRWKETHTIDEHGMTRRTIAGKVFFRGNFIDDKKLSTFKTAPDSYRGFLIPPNVSIPPSFKRMSMDFTVPEDGLGLEYTIIDEEQYTNPPIGLTKFEAEYSASTTKSAIWSDKVVARGWADPTVPKAKILDILVQLCLQTFDVQTIVQGVAFTVWDGSFLYKLHENYAEVSIQRVASGAVSTFQSLNAATLGKLKSMDYLSNGIRQLKPPMFPAGIRGDQGNLGMIAFSQYLNQCIQPSQQQLSTPVSI